MNHARSQRIVMDGNGSYLGMSKGCFVLRDRKGNEEKYPLFENQIKEVVLQSGNSISTGALASLGFWDVDVLVMTAKGRPVAVMKGLDDDSHVKTRLCHAVFPSANETPRPLTVWAMMMVGSCFRARA